MATKANDLFRKLMIFLNSSRTCSYDISPLIGEPMDGPNDAN